MKAQRRFYKPARPAPVSREPFEVEVDHLSHDGRGLARHQGKTLFVQGALPGERVEAQLRARHGKYDEAECLRVIDAAAERTAPPCPHFARCGGCELQHLADDAQIAAKQRQALDLLRRIGGVQPEVLLPPLDDAHWHYRRRARLGLRCGRDGRPVLGFRERGSNRLLAIDACPVLDRRADALLPALQRLLLQADTPGAIGHLELAYGDADGALVVRHPRPLAAADRDALLALCREHALQLYLQPAGPESLARVDGEEARLHYALPDQGLSLAFHPGDFTQVNAGINRAMVEQALALLAPGPGDRILDLFAGLGNFTLALARHAGKVVGVEGSAAMVARGEENARANGLDNVHFHAADLTRDFRDQPWFAGGFDKILLDPPRAGALEVVRHLAGYGARTLLYVSCDPATLARDAAALVDQGYRLSHWGVMNMFPQTTHVESMALFEHR